MPSCGYIRALFDKVFPQGHENGTLLLPELLTIFYAWILEA